MNQTAIFRAAGDEDDDPFENDRDAWPQEGDLR
ncbi:hypothetical protein SAMN06272771_7737 [Streptomyces sp. Ag82_O1-12]|nr:hypothetical protein SAMN06272771_7737 [Streptomyces sp. Ag82_O1-12]SOE08227.1 hypothetical protein SAMN06272727_7718 [Streptomyces sp. Ag82_G6-1]